MKKGKQDLASGYYRTSTA